MYISDKVHCKIAEAQLRARGLLLAIRGHFDSAPRPDDSDAAALEVLGLDCMRGLDEVLVV